ncbi:unnamed protein product [Colias eurytheme]|nr:unnamed protein product [Colias eurytheme]
MLGVMDSMFRYFAHLFIWSITMKKNGDGPEELAIEDSTLDIAEGIVSVYVRIKVYFISGLFRGKRILNVRFGAFEFDPDYRDMTYLSLEILIINIHKL